MAANEELVDKFGDLPDEIMTELQSMLTLYRIDAEELFFKWEEYCLKMGEDVKTDLKNVRAFKQDTREQFEIEMRSKSKTSQTPAGRGAQRTVKNAGDMFNMLDNLAPATPRTGQSAAKRKLDKASYETPLAERTSRLAVGSSPVGPPSAFKLPASPAASIPFRSRIDPGKVMEVLNDQIEIPTLPLDGYDSFKSRVELITNVLVPRFSYKPMYQKLTEASQYLDDRINDYTDAIQQEHSLPDEDFCNPSAKLPEEVVVVGRIVSDVMDSQKRTNEASLLLEGSRGKGEGKRVRLDLSALKGYALFPGMLAAFKAINPTGDKLLVKSVLSPPRYPEAASKVQELEKEMEKLMLGNLNVFMAAGPYTPDDNLDFEGLTELVDKIVEKVPDVVFLTGPFIDTEHPKVKLGDFEIDMTNFSGYVLEDLFKEKITSQLKRITKSLVILIPSTRDAVSKHVSYPQEPLQRKLLGLPTNVRLLPNPCVLSINEVVFGISSLDILFHLSMQEVKSAGKGIETNTFHRMVDHVISQNHFYPLFPPPEKSQVGYTIPLDVVWLELCEFPVKPDVLILPSTLPGSARVVNGAVTINPGFLSTKRQSGTYAFMTVESPGEILDSNRDPEADLKHRIYNRARVEIRRI
ncbi:hypothetical protein H072_8945 [Dactylellina haptotyla CBS 200.50]|uniref:DNA polymerase alpha subunit B n=1 Tax=Dactylellina haptotyla (strain CBS 200.50) TaxID=1284197 RepID=S8A310_DACHA|nr:hypothetical protein H072_8945 [Dactylellina haptotyla CBS 200.50]